MAHELSESQIVKINEIKNLAFSGNYDEAIRLARELPEPFATSAESLVSELRAENSKNQKKG